MLLVIMTRSLIRLDNTVRISLNDDCMTKGYNGGTSLNNDCMTNSHDERQWDDNDDRTDDNTDDNTDDRTDDRTGITKGYNGGTRDYDSITRSYKRYNEKL